eukprot:CAMPEP_0178425014 /NCGR_PEP_ID=MMETSP0689_2-20121128/28506_1 /TAXON_ID=160604 /ORGANISM="Amphidinium massartii, Strain CS-259" /LENGTH=82 /DNA_ID=CAMNT_0020046667 /DNA_START=380 /DNA_END=628 /DNA_ORIENTATION=-
MGRRMLLDGQLNLRTSSQQTPRWRFSSGRCVTVLWEEGGPVSAALWLVEQVARPKHAPMAPTDNRELGSDFRKELRAECSLM